MGKSTSDLCRSLPRPSEGAASDPITHQPAGLFCKPACLWLAGCHDRWQASSHWPEAQPRTAINGDLIGPTVGFQRQ